MPIFFIKRHKGLDEERNKKRCGYIYEDLNYKIRGAFALSYPIVYQLRFVVLVFIVLYLEDVLVF